MAARAEIELKGLTDLRLQLQGLGAQLTEQAQILTDRTADDVATAVKAAYREGPTGNLKKGVRVRKGQGAGHRALSVVASTAPHAHLYEYGTAARAFQGRNRGTMPGRPVMSATAARLRRELQAALEAMVARETGAELRRSGGE